MRPPRLARVLLRLTLPASDREYTLGDLDEEFAQRARSGVAGARRWYWRQARRSITYRPRAESATPENRSPFRAVAATWQDARYAFASLRRSPGFVAVAAATLALGVGANAAIFALVDAVLVRGLPFADSGQLVVVRNGFTDGRPGEWFVSYPDFTDYRDATTDTFSHLAAWQPQLPALTSADGSAAQRLNAVDASWNLLPALGVEPILGRGFLPEEDTPGSGQRAALLSHSLWQTRYGADQAIVGSSMRLDGIDYPIVGVLPRGFTGVVGGGVLSGVAVDVWLAYATSFSSGGLEVRGLTNVGVIGRLAHGATPQQGQAAITAISQSLDERFPENRTAMGGRLLSAEAFAVEGVGRTLLLTFGAVSLLLLIACTNVAGLLLGRGSARQREVALRAALGAGRTRLVRQFVVESVLVAAVGAGLGTLVAWAGVAGLRASEALQIANIEAVTLDLRVVAFLFSVALTTGLAFGVGPAFHATRTDPQAALSVDERTASGSRSYARQGMVVAQIALAVVLLAGAGLLLRSMQRVLDVDPGFVADGVLTAHIQLPMDFVADESQWRRAIAFFQQLDDRLEAIPGVVAASAAYQIPTSEGWNNAFDIDPGANPGIAVVELPAGRTFQARFRPVSPGYFATAGIPLVAGRDLSDQDTADAAPVVVINAAFAAAYFAPGSNPIGARLRYGNWWAGGDPDYEIVGMVADVRFSGRTRDSYPAAYFPHPQQPVREMSVLLRTAGDPLDLVAPLRQAVAALDPTLPVDSIALLSDQLAAQETSRRSLAVLLAIFAGTALALAAIGVYGLLGFQVAQRTREMGIRLALGARPADVRRLIVGHAFALTLVGLAVGISASAVLGRFLDRMLFEISPADPITIVGVAVFLGVIALTAAWLPASRATRVDAARSLRAD